VSICDAMLPELTEDDQNTARAAVNDRSASVDR